MISTHVLDTSRGRPAAGVSVLLERVEAGSGPAVLARASTDADGRVHELLTQDRALTSGQYHLTFEIGAYFERMQMESFHPTVTVDFLVRDATQHHHVPLLVTPFGYTTYRGS